MWAGVRRGLDCRIRPVDRECPGASPGLLKGQQDLHCLRQRAQLPVAAPATPAGTAGPVGSSTSAARLGRAPLAPRPANRRSGSTRSRQTPGSAPDPPHPPSGGPPPARSSSSAGRCASLGFRADFRLLSQPLEQRVRREVGVRIAFGRDSASEDRAGSSRHCEPGGRHRGRTVAARALCQNPDRTYHCLRSPGPRVGRSALATVGRPDQADASARTDSPPICSSERFHTNPKLPKPVSFRSDNLALNSSSPTV